MARLAGISRNTLSSVESGDPGLAIGTYLHVMSVLGISGELDLLAGDALQPGPRGTAATRSKRARPVLQVTVSTDNSRHQAQDLQREAVRQARSEPELLFQANDTLDRRLASGNSRSMGLWQEWAGNSSGREVAKVLGRPRRAQELRQASPLTAVLPAELRQSVLDQVHDLRDGIVLGNAGAQGPA